MGNIYITRHGETEWNIIRRMQGQDNSPLTELGKKQAMWLAERIKDKDIKLIYSSPLERAMNTANIIRGNRDIEIIPCDELKEIYLGSWQGQLIGDVKKLYPEKHECFWNKPKEYIPVDGETFEALVERAGKLLERILENHEDDNILLIGHAIVIKALLNFISHNGDLTYFWDGPNLKPTSLSKVVYHQGQVEVDFIGDVSHHLEVNKTGGWFLDEADE